jgi:hypothetical protein
MEYGPPASATAQLVDTRNYLLIKEEHALGLGHFDDRRNRAAGFLTPRLPLD